MAFILHPSSASPLLAHKLKRIYRLERQVTHLAAALSASQRQEVTTHDALHDWRDAASGYYVLLDYAQHTIAKRAADGHSPQSILDDIKALLSKTKAPLEPAGRNPERAQQVEGQTTEETLGDLTANPLENFNTGLMQNFACEVYKTPQGLWILRDMLTGGTSGLDRKLPLTDIWKIAEATEDARELV